MNKRKHQRQQLSTGLWLKTPENKRKQTLGLGVRVAKVNVSLAEAIPGKRRQPQGPKGNQRAVTISSEMVGAGTGTLWNLNVTI